MLVLLTSLYMEAFLIQHPDIPDEFSHHTERERERDTHIHIHTERDTDTHCNGLFTKSGPSRKSFRDVNAFSHTHTDTYTHIHTHTYTQRERETHTHTDTL